MATGGGGWKRHGEAGEEQQTVREGKRHSRERGILLCLQSPAEGEGRGRRRVDDCLHERRGRNGPMGDWSTLRLYTHILTSKVAFEKTLCPEKPSSI